VPVPVQRAKIFQEFARELQGARSTKNQISVRAVTAHRDLALLFTLTLSAIAQHQPLPLFDPVRPAPSCAFFPLPHFT
jgi:hypothetical protein